MTIGSAIPVAGKTTRAAIGTRTSHGTVRTAITFPARLFASLKAEAVRQNVSIAHMVRTYVEIGLADDRRLLGADGDPDPGSADALTMGG
jgi:hypothetical protein